jgi:hypothetical protein
LAGCARTAAARCGRPTGLPCALRASIGAGSTSKPSSQALCHGVRPSLPVRASVEQALAEQRAPVVDPVAEDVQVLVVAVDRGDLRRGYHADPVHGAGGEGLVHAVDRVVVGQREQLDAGPGGVLHHLSGRQIAVRMERMRLKVEGRGAHGEPHIRG